MDQSAPKEIPVIVALPPNLLLLDVAGPMEVLRKANLAQTAVRYRITYVAPEADGGTSIGLDIANLQPLPDHLPGGAMVVVAGNTRWPGCDLERIERGEALIVDWLKRSIRPGMRLVCICSGALLAARAGLLDGYACTSHHGCTSELAAIAPKARVFENRLFVEDGERLTSAGITTGIDLMLHLVAKECGPAVTVTIARWLVVYLRRGGDDPQLSPWLEGRNHLHPAVHKAQDAVTENPARDWSVTALARVAATSPRNLSRLFNEHAGLSVTDYVNRIRVALARELVTGSRLDMESVAEKAGFASPRQLRRAWNRYHALPPSGVRRDVAQ